MASNINFPNSFDNNTTLFIAVNNLRTSLTSSISASDTSIPVVTTSGFPSNGFITILSDLEDITKAEAIKYDGITPTSFTVIERGSEDTPNLPHLTGDNVDHTVVAAHHEVVKDAIVELEHFVGVSGSETFPRFTDQNGIIVPGFVTANGITVNSATVSGALSVSGTSIFANITVTGTSSLCGDVDIKNDLTVSGIAKFGQDDTPPSSTLDIVFASQDTEQTTTSLTFVDANCETAALDTGVDYLVIYAGNLGSNSTSDTGMQVLFGGTKIAGAGFAKSALGTFGDVHYNSAYLHGIYKVTGNGTDTVKFQFKSIAATTAYAGAMSITCIPLDDFTENTDWFYAENTNSDGFDVLNASTTDPASVSLLSSTFNSMGVGNWIFLWSSEGDVEGGVTLGAAARFQVAGSTIGTSRYTWQGRTTGTLVTNGVAAANIVNVAGGEKFYVFCPPPEDHRLCAFKANDNSGPLCISYLNPN